MKGNVQIQYADRNKLDFEDYGIVSLEKIINIFNEFNWGQQYEIMNQRSLKKLTSSIPTFIISKEKDIESLFIYGIKEGCFEIIYQKKDKIGTAIITNDVTLNKGFSPHDYIVDFFKGNLKATIKLEDQPILQDEIELGNYSLKKYLIYLVILLFPLGIVLFSQGNFENSSAIIRILIYGTLGTIILLIPFFVILFQYFSKPKLLKSKYSFTDKTLVLYYSKKEKIIETKNIEQCVFVYSTNHRLPWSSCSNVVITLKNKEQHFLTSLTFSHRELSSLLELLNVNYFYFDKPIQTINKTIFLEKALQNTPLDIKLLKKTYSEYTDEKLDKVLENAINYQPQVIEMVKQIKKERNLI
ncbi:MAG: hypothetical protein N4A45_00320 [Flavobacteriales bacterium]|jgi:hypothetical protein|nr:hypothetical protein [Flavobacteriales bacterium]